MKREPRLRFTDADFAEPELKKPIKRVKKAEAKADQAQAKIPKNPVVKKERDFDPSTGKVKTHLRFEEVDRKKPPSKLTHAVQDAPANFVLSHVHREVAQSENDNAGVEAAHKIEEAVESGGRLAQSVHRSHQLKPYRASIRAEEKLEKANIRARQKKAQIETPTSNPFSKWQQKQAIKRQYAAAKHSGTAQKTAKTAENTTKAAKKAIEKAEEAAQFVWRHKKGFAIVAGLFLILAFFLNGLSSCSVLLEGVGSGIAASTYPSQDADMLGAEAAYCNMEAKLQTYLDNYERTHDYDEYHFDLDEIEHDPYDRAFRVLAITVRQKDWDTRFSHENKAWAKTIPVFENPDAWGSNRNCYLVVNSHSGLVDLFLSQVRKDYAQKRQKSSVRDKLKMQPKVTSPQVAAKSKGQER